MQIDRKKLLKLGEKHQKWLENTSVNAEAYKINNNYYYLSHYESKFSAKVKAYAVISPDSQDRKEALESIKPHIYYFISINNLRESGSHRANLDFSVLEKIRDYLKFILESGILNPRDRIIYQRSLTIMQTMIDLQHEIIQLFEDSNSLEEGVVKNGYFTDDDINEALHYIVMGNLIQYKQFKDRYDNCKDFDIIYDNRNNPEIKPFEKYLDIKILKGMTSEVAEPQLKKSLDGTTKNNYVGHMTESEIYALLMKTYREGLDKRVQQAKDILRYP
ncbi:hypothetical protein KFZ58_03530 [Virgibacillus sp. NKC19-16]|uniref:hypothetical protein n=1 Tax=Virgibacillus salidurans TaxID=2831673 RepID=UPI001F2351DB|nr:hypothetical protein [Virgibacillus sp. NKC19-16]UJL47028.1 hypothetical protein KFZ58_03530 [Virgibacillus sp. NKC19-16]